MLENIRFHPGEEKNDPEFAKRLAALGGDVYVNDAFSTAHRAHASTTGLALLMPSCAGRLMQAELEALEAALGTPARPVVAVVGGAKVSTKLDLLSNLVEKVDHLVIGGGMANTFLAAQGFDVGKSLCEHDMADTAREIMTKATTTGCEIILPEDVVIAREFAANAAHETLPATECPADAMILDAGPKTVARICATFETARTLIWNGPLGAFEIPPFGAATNAAALKAGALTRAGTLISVAGGGDTVAALNQADAAEDFTYISTAGGAFLEWMEGKTCRAWRRWVADCSTIASLATVGSLRRGYFEQDEGAGLLTLHLAPNIPGGLGAAPPTLTGSSANNRVRSARLIEGNAR